MAVITRLADHRPRPMSDEEKDDLIREMLRELTARFAAQRAAREAQTARVLPFPAKRRRRRRGVSADSSAAPG